MSRPSAENPPGRPTFLSDPRPEKDVLEVHSRFRLLYYTAFRGYRVTRESSAPKPSLFGGVAYRHTWLLKKVSKQAP